MKKFNNYLALKITNMVGTMYCAYLFGVIGIMGVYYSLTGNTKGALIIGSISGYFLQLVLLPIIIVGQNLQAKKTEESNATMKALHKHVKEIHKETVGVKEI